jgi:hypothetical protein
LRRQRPTQEVGDGGGNVTTDRSGSEQAQENVGLTAEVRTTVIGEDISVTARVVTSTHRDEESFVDQQVWTDAEIRVGGGGDPDAPAGLSKADFVPQMTITVR